MTVFTKYMIQQRRGLNKKTEKKNNNKNFGEFPKELFLLKNLVISKRLFFREHHIHTLLNKIKFIFVKNKSLTLGDILNE